MTPITLASASVARAAILRGAGVAFDIEPSGVDEDAVKRTMLSRQSGPAVVAEGLAELKALAVSRRRHGLVIGADQTLDLDGVIHDKIIGLDQVRARLYALRGRAHRLHAAVTLARDGQILWRTLSSPTLAVRAFSPGFLEAYLDRCGEGVTDSVGAYHLEGIGAQLFELIEGDYFAVLGLPLIALLAALRQFGGLAE